MARSPILGGFSVQRSTRAADNEIYNLFPEIIETKDGKQPGALYLTSGLTLQATVGPGPIRALHNVRDLLYVVSGPYVYQIFPSGLAYLLGAISNASTPVSVVDNGTQVLFFDGQAAFIHTIVPNDVHQILLPYYDGTVLPLTGSAGGGSGEPLKPVMGTFIDSYCLVIFQGSDIIAQSNVRDFNTWDPLNFAHTAAQADVNIAIASIHDELFILKQTNTEVWVNNGATGFSFTPLTGVNIEYGAGAPFSLTKVGETLMWLSRNPQGVGLVIQLNGYQPQIVSTQALVYEFSQYPTLGDAIGYSYQEGGHLFYMLVFPEADKAWCYDVTASNFAGYPVWHRRAAWDPATGWHRHYGNAFVNFS